jgi:tRNA (guanosine-2'-O-)-methyltransferase
MPRSPRRLEKIRRVLGCRQPGLRVVMENIHDPHNVSAIFRTCDAVGAMQVELLYTTEEFPRIGKKSSSSANKWVEKRRHTTVEGCFSALRSEGFRILATRIGGEAHSLYGIELTEKVAFVLGNEHRGVSDEAAAGADALIAIPMVGMIESLNVSVAAAVCLYEALRQRLEGGMMNASQVPDEEFEELYRAWVRL